MSKPDPVAVRIRVSLRPPDTAGRTVLLHLLHTAPAALLGPPPCRTWLGAADGFFTFEDERAGYPRTRAALAGYDSDDLIKEYLQSSRDGLNAMFGHNARRYGNLVADELLRRGITQLPNLFGPLPVKRWAW